jgi:hypothetical protein
MKPDLTAASNLPTKTTILKAQLQFVLYKLPYSEK